MTTLQVKFQRSPRTLIVNNNTIVIHRAGDTAPTDDTEVSSCQRVQDSGQQPAIELGRACSANEDLADSGSRHPEEQTDTDTGLRSNPSGMPTSIATVITDASRKTVTPLAQSNAVPVLSGATHEVITAAEMGFCGVSEEELGELKLMLASVAELVIELQEQHRQSLNEMQEVAVELASAAASWLVGVAIDRDQFAVDDLIRNALQHMELDQPVRVRLNPADHALLKNLVRDPEGRGLLANVSCCDDAMLVRGSCRVESGRRILLTDMNSRLDDIRRTWMEKLDDSQIERRGDGSASGTLRRFPDRRETA